MAPKKFEVLAVEGDTVKKINFGDPNMSIKKDQPKRKVLLRTLRRHQGQVEAKKARITGRAARGIVDIAAFRLAPR